MVRVISCHDSEHFATTADACAIFDIASTPSRVQYGTVHIYAVADVNTVIAVNDVNTVNEEPNAISDSCLMNENKSLNEEYGASISPIVFIIRGLFESAQ